MKYFLLLFTFFCATLFVSQIPDDDPAIAFLDSLNNDQLTKARKPFDDLTRHTWHFLPAAMWPRPGIPLQDLDQNQKELLFDVLQSFLSETGYDKTRSIMGLENVLAEIENRPDFRDPELYYTTFYGDPGDDEKWAWSFEGHHISLNFTVVEGEVSMVPRFLGARPSLIPEGPKKVRKQPCTKRRISGLN